MQSPFINDWGLMLNDQLSKSYMQSLRNFLLQCKSEKKIIYPHSKNWFRAFHLTPLHKVKIVILGQDPYHAPQQANGLSFSVQHGVQIPPSLRNIYYELNGNNVDFELVGHGCLDKWALGGVMLLNSVLTVEKGKAGSHRNKGWEKFTDHVVNTISKNRDHVVFMLWGQYAQSKMHLIDTKRHLVLEACHPSPLSAHRGFFGKQHFSKANNFLVNNSIKPICWRL